MSWCRGQPALGGGLGRGADGLLAAGVERGAVPDHLHGRSHAHPSDRVRGRVRRRSDARRPLRAALRSLRPGNRIASLELDNQPERAGLDTRGRPGAELRPRGGLERPAAGPRSQRWARGALCAAGIFLTGSRGAAWSPSPLPWPRSWSSAPGGAGAWWSSIVAVVLAGVGYFTYVASPETRSHVSTVGSGTGRLDLWTVGWRMVEEHPLQGVGAGNFPVSSVHYLLQPGRSREATTSSAHPRSSTTPTSSSGRSSAWSDWSCSLHRRDSACTRRSRRRDYFARQGDVGWRSSLEPSSLPSPAFLAADFFGSRLTNKEVWLLFGSRARAAGHRALARAARPALDGRTRPRLPRGQRALARGAVDRAASISEQHVRLLAERGFVGVTFHEAVLGPPAPKTLAITFDDAYRSVIELALPDPLAGGIRGHGVRAHRLRGHRGADGLAGHRPLARHRARRRADADVVGGAGTPRRGGLGDRLPHPLSSPAARRSTTPRSTHELRDVASRRSSVTWGTCRLTCLSVRGPRRPRGRGGEAGGLRGRRDPPREAEAGRPGSGLASDRHHSRRRPAPLRWKVSPVVRKARATAAWSLLHAARPGGAPAGGSHALDPDAHRARVAGGPTLARSLSARSRVGRAGGARSVRRGSRSP